ncbi:DUF4031 domain-containing protein [Luteococcus sp. Sow4_B9]|uniref:DUF4031 domain-containing protein n=1 Tax=Luteococcus sp. Sow4_B9 TaxID=3438792 RepID=UPI003F9A54F0
MLLVDSPRWPAHGSVYGHLVSDANLWELHEGARAAGLDVRAFDHDHYDLRVDRLGAALAAGAVQVDERDLVDRLRAVGLRILPHQKAPRRRRAREEVRSQVLEVLPRTDEPAVRTIDSLLDRQQVERRRYHDLRHLAEMLRTQRRLAELSGTSLHRTEVLATFFHDVVHHGAPGEDERSSADLAGEMLPTLGLPDAEVSEVQRLVLITLDHAPKSDDPSGQRISDADMAILASAPGRYHVSVRDLRREYARFDDVQWRSGRRGALTGFLGMSQIFHGTHAGRLFEATARERITEELAHLDGSYLEEL